MHRKPIILFTFLLLMTFPVSAETYYAKPNGADDATCADEANAGSISNAVARALSAANNTVILADGDYDCSNVSNKTQNAYAFYLDKAITIKSKSDDPDKVRLVGSGTMDKKKACLYICSPVTLRALTFTDFYSSVNGSAIRVKNDNGGSLSMTNCTIVSCRTSGEGGAFYEYNSKVNLYNCRIRNCSSSYRSGAVFSGAGTTTAYDCEVADCYVDSEKNGVNVFKGTWNRCVFSGCYITGTGGNAVGAVATQANLNNCVVSNCWSVSSGGGSLHNCMVTDSIICAMPTNGIYYGGTFERCTFRDNKTYLTCNVGELIDCLIVSNSFVANKGSKHALVFGNTIRNCTFVRNYQPAGDGGWNVGGIIIGKSTVENCIFAENDGSRLFAADPTHRITLKNCLYPAAASGSYYAVDSTNGVLLAVASAGVSEFEQVKFVGKNDQGLPYYSLRRKSPAVDKGDNLTYTEASVDLAGNPRVVTRGQRLAEGANATVDIGCYEMQEKDPGLAVIIR